MKVVSFKLMGKMAHFRKIYSNSSALSYFLPPRTTIMGILAGLMGYERDSYYDLFNREQCKIAVAINQPIKKNLQTLNYLMIKKIADFNGSQPNHSQTPTELIIPQNIREGQLEYQIWVFHKNQQIMEGLEALMAEEVYLSSGISLALGPAYNLGWIESAGLYTGEIKTEERAIPIHSAMPIEQIEALHLDEMEQKYKIIKEEVPLEFNSDRQITQEGMGYMLVNLNPSPINAIVKKEYVQLSDEKNILWME
ncbi:CRISPR-associated protein Cas5 [Alkaliphilus crotonatoxidans]